MTNCRICWKKVWFFQNDMRVLTEPDEYGDRYGRHIHKKCKWEDR